MNSRKMKTWVRPLALESQVESTIGISTKLKMHEHIEKINFINIVFVSISINRDYLY